MLFNSVFLNILQIFSPEVTLIRDQDWTNVGAMVHTILSLSEIYAFYTFCHLLHC